MKIRQKRGGKFALTLSHKELVIISEVLNYSEPLNYFDELNDKLFDRDELKDAEECYQEESRIWLKMKRALDKIAVY
jgi:hypothetical protein